MLNSIIEEKSIDQTLGKILCNSSCLSSMQKETMADTSCKRLSSRLLLELSDKDQTIIRCITTVSLPKAYDLIILSASYIAYFLHIQGPI